MKYLKSLEDVGIRASVRIGKERIYVNTRLFALLKFEEEEEEEEGGCYR